MNDKSILTEKNQFPLIKKVEFWITSKYKVNIRRVRNEIQNSRDVADSGLPLFSSLSPVQ